MNDPLNNATAAPVDPLNESFTTVDTSFPLIQSGTLAEFKVSKSEVKQPAEAGKAPSWQLTFEALQPVTSQDNEQLTNAKFTVFTQLAPVGKSTWDIVKKSVATLLQGLKLTDADMGGSEGGWRGQLSRIDSWHKGLEGRMCRIKVGIDKARADAVTGKEYAARNTIAAFVK